MNSELLTAEFIASSSLLFVAGAYKEDGSKFLDAVSGEWVMDVFTFDLVEAFDDTLEGDGGDDVLIGQRGNDFLSTGQGDDLAIGDAGSNKIATNLEFPRIYQMYRSMKTAGDYAPGASDLGMVFTADFELRPLPYRYLDSQASIVDEVLTIDDASDEADLLRDVLGISGSIRTEESYCMKPLFKIIPGFVAETDMLHGDDTIVSSGGRDFLVGDDIRGFR